MNNFITVFVRIIRTIHTFIIHNTDSLQIQCKYIRSSVFLEAMNTMNLMKKYLLQNDYARQYNI